MDTTFGLASTSLEMTAMENGDIDMVVDYSGQVYLSVLGLPLNTNTDEVYEILSEKMRDDYNISGLRPPGLQQHLCHERPAGDRRAVSARNPHRSDGRSTRTPSGCTADFTQREDALPRPGVHLPYQVRRGSTLWTWRCAIPPSTAARWMLSTLRHRRLLSKFDLVQLEDDASFFPPYYAVNFIRQECLDEYPELKEVLALLDGRISNEAMAAMNAEVDLEGRNAADVAHDFLVEEGLI